MVLLLLTALASGLWLSNRNAAPPLPATAPTLAVLPRNTASLADEALEEVRAFGLRFPELALAGEYTAALVVLEPVVDPLIPAQHLGSGQDRNVRHALAWAWLQTGHASQAETLLQAQAAYYREAFLGGRLQRSHDLFEYARNQALLGETGQALDLLAQAEQAGWRGYYHILHDPRWAALRGEERFQELMARIRGQLDEQRARIGSLEADAAFGERLERVIASRTGEF